MNTTELKKLAEAATPGPWIAAGPSFGGEFPVYCEEVLVDREHDDDDGYGYGICQAPTGLEKESTHDMTYIAAANPSAILELLAINAKLVEALKAAKKALDAIGDEMIVGERYTNAGQYLIEAIEPVNAALAKAEGGEL